MTQLWGMVDIGGSNTRVGVTSNLRVVDESKKFETPGEFSEGVIAIESALKGFLREGRLSGLAVGVAGSIDRGKGELFRTPNLGWNGKPLEGKLRSIFGEALWVENDADLAALGEAVFGAGKGRKIVAFLTISTGIGGGRVVEGKIEEAAWGFEPGHQLLTEGKTLEDLASGSAFEKRCGMHPKDCADQKLWDEEAIFLGQGIVNTMVHWSPDVVVLGGSMANSWDLFYEPMMDYVTKHLTVMPVPPVVRGTLGDQMGLYGGMALLAQKQGKMEGNESSLSG